MAEPLRSRLRPATSPGGLTSPDPVTAPHGRPIRPPAQHPAWPRTPDKPHNRERHNKHAHENYKITLVQPVPWKRSPEFARWIEAKSAPEMQSSAVRSSFRLRRRAPDAIAEIHFYGARGYRCRPASALCCCPRGPWTEAS